jgi:DNA-binding XRE family transcriptional regulator
MVSALLGKILKYSQTLGKEDVLTAILATMFDYSNNFKNHFLKQIELNNQTIIEMITPSCGIKTGITYFSENRLVDEKYMLRPDILISTENFSFTETSSQFVLLESKLSSDLTTNQYLGYPEIKNIYKENVAIILISNYYKNEHEKCFDKVISWAKVFEISKDYILNQSNNYEKIVLQELLNTFYEFGIKYSEFLFAEIAERVNPELSMAALIKDYRKKTGMTQIEFSKEVGVALTVIRGLEQNQDKGYNISSVNKILEYFNCELGPVKKNKSH